MKKLLIRAAAPLCLGASLAGCSTLQNDFNSASTWLASPQAAAVQTFKTGATGLVCQIANMAALSGAIASQVNAGQAFQTTDGKVVTISSDVCSALSGTVTGTTTVTSVPASAATAQ